MTCLSVYVALYGSVCLEALATGPGISLIEKHTFAGLNHKTKVKHTQKNNKKLNEE